MTADTTIRAAIVLTRIGHCDLAREIMLVADKWETRPSGWDEKSVTRFWSSIGGSVSKCIKKLADVEAIDNPGAFCAALKDRIHEFHGAKEPTKWRGKK